MLLVLEFDGLLFRWQGQGLSPDQVMRWLRWRRPEQIELRRGDQCCRLGCSQLLALLERKDPVAGAYRALGLSAASDGAAVKRAWRRLARQHHPDRGGAPQKMQELNAAYRLLREPVEAAAQLSMTG
jgi:DnaJ-domain-containing protein 1